jgi:hypothetical protein
MTLEIVPVLSTVMPKEKTEHDVIEGPSLVLTSEGENMIEKGIILTGNDAELLSHALSEVKKIVYKKTKTQLDDAQALDAIVSYFLNAEG